MGEPTLKDKILTFLRNLKTVHHRWMMEYLGKRGWVVFYLEDEFRVCNDGWCWLKLYEDEVKRGN